MISLNLRHPLGRITTLLLFLFSAILWTSCDEKEKPLSSENLIVRLSLNDGDKEYAAKISSGTLSVELTPGSTLPTEMTISVLALSPEARASTSVNSKLTLAEGRATITVTAENKATKEYTLIVTVKKNAAADLKSLSVAIGGKNYTATLSNSQASVLLPASVDVPAFVTVASLEVSGQARASVTVGGRIDLTNGAGRIVVTAEDGTTTRSYTLEVRKEEANQANLFALSIRFGETVYEAVISGDVATFSGVSRSMTSGTITAINISEGARSSVAVDGALSFTDGEGRLTITANGGQTRKTIAVKLEGAALSTEAELSALSLTIGGVTYVATISGTVATVLTPQVVTSASVASLSYTTGATSSVQQGGALTFTGGTSAITITAPDGKTMKVYQIVLAKEGDFLTSFSFQAEDNSYTSPYTAFTTSLGEIDQTSGMIEVELSPYLRGVELASLVPSFTTIEGATVVVGTAAQESGGTPNDFNGGVVTYTVSLAGRSKEYMVSVVLSNLAWIPDANFRSELAKILPLTAATPNDSLITDHSSVAGLITMDVSYVSISSMMGLEFFKNLRDLSCDSNQLTSLDVSANTKLTKLDCDSNRLVNLNLSANTELTTLDCFNNRLTSLDLSANTELTTLDCHRNKLRNLNPSSNIALTKLHCYDNQLTSLGLSSNMALTELHCYDNQLTSLDLSGNIALTELHCYNNQLTSLDLSVQQQLTSLVFDAEATVDGVVKNLLKNLKVHENFKDYPEVRKVKQSLGKDVIISTYNTARDEVCKDYNPLAMTCNDGSLVTSFSIDLASNNIVTTYTGRTSLISEINHEAQTITVWIPPYRNNINPTILSSLKVSFEVKSGATVTVGGIEQVSGVTPNSFSTPVTYSVISGGTTKTYEVSVKETNLAWIPDPKFRARLKTLPLAGAFFTQNDSLIADHSNVRGLTEMRTYNSRIDSMIGLEFFTGLLRLYCSSNNLTSLDVSQNIALTNLACHSNQLRSLDVTKNIALTELRCNANALMALDVTKNIALTDLGCNANALMALDVTKNIALINLDCSSNQLTSLDMSKNIALTSLDCYVNDLTALDVTKNIALAHLGCSSNQLTSLDVTKNIALTSFLSAVNPLMTLDVTQNIALRVLRCSSNQLTSLDVTQNIALIDIQCFSNQLTVLDVTKNIKLVYFSCYSNQLTSLDVTQNIALINLDCYSNLLTSLDLSQNTGLRNLRCHSNQLTSLDVRAQQLRYALSIGAGETENDVIQNPLTTLHVHEDVKDNAEFIEAKTNRVNALTISTYTTEGGTACNNYDPREASRGCKD